MRIGLLSYWGFGRGLANVTLNFVKTVKDEHECFILKQGTNPNDKEFDIEGVKVTEYPNYIVDPEVFKLWITENKLDAVVFNEYKQWNPDSGELIQVAKSLGCKAYGYLVLERFKYEQTLEYDRVFAHTQSFVKFMRKNKVRNFTYVPFSLDLTEFPEMDMKSNEKFTFFHPGGFGGVHNRKNTEVVVEAFRKLREKRDDVKLVITSQKQIDYKDLPEDVEIINKNLDREDLIMEYYKADAVVLPSKWETIGIPILEALASHTPVITSNIPPMNEFVRPGLNGYLVDGELNEYDNITIFALDVDVGDLRVTMETMMNETVHGMLCRNSRHVVEQLYDLEKNKKHLLDFLKGEEK